MIFFSTEDYFNSLEHCQSKQTVSYNVEWCLQLQYVECSGDKWYCDTELLSKVMDWASPNCTFKIDLIFFFRRSFTPANSRERDAPG